MEAPNGFRLDPNSGLYYSEKRSTDSATGAPVRLVTWFDPKTGISKQTSYPAPAAKPSAPKASKPTPAQTAPAPTLASAPIIPDGFVFDPQSRLYYRSENGVDGAGAPIQRVTYYDPGKRSYHAVDYPIAQVQTQAQEAQPLPAPAEPSPDFSDVLPTLRQEPYQPAPKKKALMPIVAACAAVLLVATLGVCAWQFEWFGGDSSPATNTNSAAGDSAEDEIDDEAQEDGDSEFESLVPLAKAYQYTDSDDNTLRLKFSGKEKFTLTYDYEGKSQTVKGTYEKLDRAGLYTIIITSDDTTPGWNGSAEFLQQPDGSMMFPGPDGGIGGFSGCWLLPD